MGNYDIVDTVVVRLISKMTLKINNKLSVIKVPSVLERKMTRTVTV